MEKLSLDRLRVESFATTTKAREHSAARTPTDPSACGGITPDSCRTCYPRCCTGDATGCLT